MATVTQTPPIEAARSERSTVGPELHGRAMGFGEFTEADLQEGWLYELARGIVVVTEVPGIHHGRIVLRINALFTLFDAAHPGIINYRAGGGECRLRLPGMKSDRHPDQAVYLHPEPQGPSVWSRWVPEIVVEVVSESSNDRDYIEKREEYLLCGIREYWILDPKRRRMLVLVRLGDTWEEHVLGEDGVHRTELLPGLEARVGELLGPPAEGEAG
jgi:Uma2 family endonuclease